MHASLIVCVCTDTALIPIRPYIIWKMCCNWFQDTLQCVITQESLYDIKLALSLLFTCLGYWLRLDRDISLQQFFRVLSHNILIDKGSMSPSQQHPSNRICKDFNALRKLQKSLWDKSRRNSYFAILKWTALQDDI